MISEEELFAAMRRVNALHKRTLERLAQSENGEPMTLPQEEVHSLQAVRRFLYDLLDPTATPRVPKAIRQRARRVCKHFPMDYSIQERYPDVFNPERTMNTTPNTIVADAAQELLDSGKTVQVEFTKKDGTIRSMICTRDMKRIPEDRHPKGTGKQRSENTIIAFDLEKGEWRSFLRESVRVVRVVEI